MGTVLINLFFQGIPEMAALIFTSLTVVRHTSNWRRVLGFGVFLAALAWSLRLMLVPFGLYSLVIMFSLAIIVYKEAKVSLGRAFFGVFVAAFLLLTMETIAHLIMEKIFGFSFSGEGWSWVMAGWPQILGLLTVALLIKKFISSGTSKIKTQGV